MNIEIIKRNKYYSGLIDIFPYDIVNKIISYCVNISVIENGLKSILDRQENFIEYIEFIDNFSVKHHAVLHNEDCLDIYKNKEECPDCIDSSEGEEDDISYQSINIFVPDSRKKYLEEGNKKMNITQN